MELKPFHLTADNIFASPFAKKIEVKETPVNPFQQRSRFFLDRYFLLAIVGLFLLSAVIASGILREFSNPSSLLAAKRYAFVQIRAIDESGAAIQGAEVSIDGKPNGYTDSFGYWQRYMRVQLGNELKIALGKDYATHSIVGRRNVAVTKQVSDKQELELKTSVVLRTEKSGATHTASNSDDLDSEL